MLVHAGVPWPVVHGTPRNRGHQTRPFPLEAAARCRPRTPGRGRLTGYRVWRAHMGVMQRLRDAWGDRVSAGRESDGSVHVDIECAGGEVTRVPTGDPSSSRVLRLAAELAERRQQ